MRFIDFFFRHFFDNLFQRNRSVWITSDCAQRVPHISAHQINTRNTATHFVIPTNTRLRPRVPLQRRPQIPFKRPLIIFGHTLTHCIQNANQLFRIGITRTCSRQQSLISFFKFARFHHITRFFNARYRRAAKQHKYYQYLSHFICLFLICGAAQADPLPAPLSASDFQSFDHKQAKLGQLLFYDKILSGNRNISCGTCHHPEHGTGDGLSLGLGEGGVGLGPDRRAGPDGIKKRIPRNATPLWNLGAKDITVLFHDGRLTKANTYENEFDSPAEEWLPTGFNSILAAQAVFPLVAQFEMAGNPGENDVAGAAHDRIDAPWPIIAKRVRVIPEYGNAFVDAFDHINHAEDVTIVEVANALAAFMATEWQSIDSPYDAYLSGDKTALDPQQISGLNLFFGKANCSECHSGKLLSDQKFHALGLPAFGPGRTRTFNMLSRDVGHMAESDVLEDAYRFRTPMLRNTAMTAPFGHNGAYPTLEGIIRHHLNPSKAREDWNKTQVVMPKVTGFETVDFIIQVDKREMRRQANAIDIKPIKLSDKEVNQLVSFIKGLNGKTTKRLGIPNHVPSGLSID